MVLAATVDHVGFPQISETMHLASILLLSCLWSTITRSTPQEKKCHKKGHSIYIHGRRQSFCLYPVPLIRAIPALLFLALSPMHSFTLHRINQLVCDKMPRPEFTFPSWLPGFLSYCECPGTNVSPRCLFETIKVAMVLTRIDLFVSPQYLCLLLMLFCLWSPSSLSIVTSLQVCRDALRFHCTPNSFIIKTTPGLEITLVACNLLAGVILIAM